MMRASALGAYGLVACLLVAACSANHAAAIDAPIASPDAPADASAPPCTTLALAALAGSIGGAGNLDGSGTAARFDAPQGITADGAGDVFVADADNDTIREIDPAGNVTTLAGLAGVAGGADGSGSAARFDGPAGLAIDGAGNLYVADRGNSAIRVVTPAGAVTTLAGLAGAIGSADGSGSAARFDQPMGIALVGATLFITDSANDDIRAVTTAGVVTTFAGIAGSAGAADGSAALAQFDAPAGIATDGSDLFVADDDNDEIRKIDPAGNVTTLAGGAGLAGSADGLGSAALFDHPTGIARDPDTGKLYVTDASNDTVRVVTVNGRVTTLAGLADHRGAADGSGTAARFDDPTGIAAVPSGDFIVADSANDAIRDVTSAGAVTTIAGAAPFAGTADGAGAAAGFDGPRGLAVGADGAIYVGDTGNDTIRSVTPAGAVTTLAGKAGSASSTDGAGTAARFDGPWGLAIGAGGNVVIADEVDRELRELGVTDYVTTLAGAAGVSGATDGSSSAARFVDPTGVAIDSAGDVFIADSGDAAIRELANGTVTTFAGTPGAAGEADGMGAHASFEAPRAIAIDAANNLYVADRLGMVIRKIAPDGAVTTLAGIADTAGYRDGDAGSALFDVPIGIAVDAAGSNLYVADLGNHAIRRIAIAGSAATVSTIAGSPAQIGIALGAAPTLANPEGVAIDGTSLVIADSNAILTLACAAH